LPKADRHFTSADARIKLKRLYPTLSLTQGIKPLS